MYTPKTAKKLKGDTLPKTHEFSGINWGIDFGGYRCHIVFPFFWIFLLQRVVLMETKALVVELLVLVLVLLVDVVEVLVTPEMAGNQGNHEEISLKTNCLHLKNVMVGTFVSRWKGL